VKKAAQKKAAAKGPKTALADVEMK